MSNPCQYCGTCCGFYRVSFRGDEACNDARRRHGLPLLDIGP